MTATMREVRVTQSVDVHTARRAARDFAREIGFDQIASGELLIVASELATNILKYGDRGSLHLEAVLDAVKGTGLTITAFDHGPPFHDFGLALRDGYDDKGPLDPAAMLRRGGIGAGLGAVKRFSDEIAWKPIDGGKWISATRYLRRPR